MTSASRKVISRGRPVSLSHGSSRSSATRSSTSSSCFSSSPDIRSNSNGFSVLKGVCGNLLSIGRRGRCLLFNAACRHHLKHFQARGGQSETTGFRISLIVAHCDSEDQARRLRAAIAARLETLGLELHPGKTKVAYCKDANRRGDFGHTSF